MSTLKRQPQGRDVQAVGRRDEGFQSIMVVAHHDIFSLIDTANSPTHASATGNSHYFIVDVVGKVVHCIQIQGTTVATS